MNSRRLARVLVGFAIGVLLFWGLRNAPDPRPASSRPTAATPAPALPVAPPAPVVATDPLVGLVGAGLNAPDGTVQRDLASVDDLLAAWRTNFPGLGNPVGENREITAALLGRNRLHLAFLPPDHPALNAAGELCDRWGTPYVFHQRSGTHMELRSAGPDRRPYTADDTVWNPAAPAPTRPLN